MTRSTGVLPAIKVKAGADLVSFVHAMYEGGGRVIEITTTTPGVFEAFETLRDEFRDRIFLAAGTTLDATTARLAILAGARVIVSPALRPEVIHTAHRYGAAIYCGAFTATEVLAAMEAGADMVKIFPATLGGPKYMTNLKMVYPGVKLCPSGGISLENAGDFIRSGADAISGNRNFFDLAMVEKHGLGWISEQVAKYIALVAEARRDLPELP
ncbi:MAG TPA: bifunctional 4-hydroxy-2-oxoglutarate aldolase/2-dehydro-3-deoxy-phosphogluconate aldolase [Anaeromyxobacter sp.]|nr:bifunctional 4-hydroxy-2-oxoglutarate aldolase/2-dehydro-3-deoxy-phosphogluconate aldolase [Anaeromyxobacter sp.]